jgi:hypothetical protein
MIQGMSASLVYLLLRQVLQMLTQLARDGGAKDVELRFCATRSPFCVARSTAPNCSPPTGSYWPHYRAYAPVAAGRRSS